MIRLASASGRDIVEDLQRDLEALRSDAEDRLAAEVKRIRERVVEIVKEYVAERLGKDDSLLDAVDGGVRLHGSGTRYALEIGGDLARRLHVMEYGSASEGIVPRPLRQRLESGIGHFAFLMMEE